MFLKLHGPWNWPSVSSLAFALDRLGEDKKLSWYFAIKKVNYCFVELLSQTVHIKQHFYASQSKKCKGLAWVWPDYFFPWLLGPGKEQKEAGRGHQGQELLFFNKYLLSSSPKALLISLALCVLHGFLVFISFIHSFAFSITTCWEQMGI
jgi:hypothetical protein